MKAKKKYLIEWRRRQVIELVSKGNNQSQIADTLQVSEATICKDLEYLREQSRDNIRKYIDEKLPNEYEKCLVGLTAILRESWDMAQKPDIDRREKIQALSLAKDCYTTKMELLTNATVVDDAIKFVAGHQNQTKEKDNDESKKHNKDEENKDKVINESKIKNEASETTVATATANQVF